MSESASPGASRPPAGAGEVFAAFLKLGLTSFGGPVAHIGYFRREFVERRGWLDDAEFTRLLALCQFLPGPASSKLGFTLGLLRSGWWGGIAGFAAFTLPSAVLLFAFAQMLPLLSSATGQAAIHGLKLVAVAVVGHAVLGMARQLCPDAPRATIAVLAAVLVLAVPQAWVQLLVVAAGGIAGLFVCRGSLPVPPLLHPRYGTRTGAVLLACFAALLVGLPIAAHEGPELVRMAEAFFRAGALVFGGGHVVLPLLRDAVVTPGWVSSSDFLAGYGAAQAVPGPLFTFAAFLGARLPGEQGGLIGAAVALLAIFLPGLLLVAGALPWWGRFGSHPAAARAVAGINAAVVGLLAAALYDPVWVSAVRAPLDVAIIAVAFTLLAVWRGSALVAVAWCVAAATLASALG